MNPEKRICCENTEVPIELYQLIDEFNSACARDPHVASIMHQGLSVFAELKDTFYASVFLMNASTFEFEHSATLPRSMTRESEQNFGLLVDKGVVGSALSTGQIISYQKSEETSPFYFVSPMIGVQGVMGLLMVCTSVSPNELSNAKLKCYSYFIQMFAKTLENAEFIEVNAKLEDILQQKVASRTIELVESQRQLVDSMEDLKVNLATAIPHEIRTPIGTILGSAAFMRDHYAEIDSADANEMLSDIYSSAQRLQRLFENYQIYTRLAITATRQLEMERLRNSSTRGVKSYIDTITRYRASIAQRSADLYLQLEDATLAIPEDLLRKLLEELCDNAFKYSEYGQTVEVRGWKRLTTYELSISDQGRGMDAHNIQNIQAYAQFDRHYHEQQGMGLGLAIVQRIADVIGAEVNISNNANKRGTLVTLRIPLAHDEEE